RDVDTGRGAMPRAAPARSSDLVAPDRTESTDNPTVGPPDGAAGVGCEQSHCRARAQSSRQAELVARYERTLRADLACGARRQTNRPHRTSPCVELGGGDPFRRTAHDQVGIGVTLPRPTRVKRVSDQRPPPTDPRVPETDSSV